MNLRTRIVWATLSSAISFQVAADVTIGLAAGSDDNPYRLNTTFEPVRDTYIHTRLRAGFEEESDKWQLNAGIDHYAFSEDPTADATNWSASARFALPDLVEGLRIQPYARLRHRSLDYVSRFRGVPYTYRGADATGRYNYNRQELGTVIDYRFNRQHELSLDLSQRWQDYDEVPGLDSLDYRQPTAELAWNYRPRRGIRISPHVTWQQRSYDSRRATNLAGERVDGLIAEYDYLEWGLGAWFSLSKQASIWASASVEDRDDADDYFDSRWAVAKLRGRYRFADHHSLTASVSYRDMAYERGTSTLINLEDQDEVPDFQGWRVSFSYERPLMEIAGYPVTWLSSVVLDRYESPLTNYEYDRTRFQTGFTVRL